ncbi:unnamed protein product [marine sediment metagenome]|uniref:Uncharacterized protein n=1 Tax=marine sediment metagenome TaxID=412755 RepID=X1EWR7_9ZZZZ
MSWWVSLEKNNKSVKVENFTAGGTYPIGGTDEAELNITYNYSEFYYRYLDKENGLKWLHQRKAKDCIERLENAVGVLGTKQYEDYWSSTKGNAGYALNILLSWARKYPEAKFGVS